MNDFQDDSGSAAAAGSSDAAVDESTQTATESDNSGEDTSSDADDDVSEEERRFVPESFQKRFTESRHELKSLKTKLAELTKQAAGNETKSQEAARVAQENAVLKQVLKLVSEKGPAAPEPAPVEPEWEFDLDDSDPAMRAAAKMERRLARLEGEVRPASEQAKQANFHIEKQKHEAQLTAQYNSSLAKHAHLKDNAEAQRLAFSLAHAGKDLAEAFDEVARLIAPSSTRVVKEAPRVIAPARSGPAPTAPIKSLADAIKAADKMLDIKKR